MSANDTNFIGKYKECPVCGNLMMHWQSLCNPCQDQKNIMEEQKRQRKRDEAFGNPWDIIRKRKDRKW